MDGPPASCSQQIIYLSEIALIQINHSGIIEKSVYSVE